jgi:DNA processing protein
MSQHFSIHDLLHLASIPKIGNNRLRNLIAQFGTPAAVMQASPRELIKVEGIDKTLARAIAHSEKSDDFIEDQLSRINRVNGRIVTLWDDEYPSLLKKIYDPPVFLFIRGRFSSHDRFSVGIVGTRNATAYGKMMTEKFSRELTGIGITIVSGLARGIDTIAHSTSLSAGGRTIAVIGSALDNIYPPENKKLCDRIEEHGVVVSEFFMGTEIDPGNFPRRNRVISGLSLGTLIVESDLTGGAMITASTALDQNRELFSIPGPIVEKKSNGTNSLIKLGRAKLVQSVEDIIEELEVPLRPILNAKEHIPSPAPQLSIFEEKIYAVLSAEPQHIDEISAKADLSPADTLVNLLGLEFKNLIKQMAGKMFVKL